MRRLPDGILLFQHLVLSRQKGDLIGFWPSAKILSSTSVSVPAISQNGARYNNFEFVHECVPECSLSIVELYQLTKTCNNCYAMKSQCTYCTLG